MAVDVVAAYVSQNAIASAQIPDVISTVYTTLLSLEAGETETASAIFGQVLQHDAENAEALACQRPLELTLQRPLALSGGGGISRFSASCGFGQGGSQITGTAP